MLNPKPLPHPFDKVMYLWKQFLAEVSPLVKVKSADVSFKLHQDGVCMEVAAIIAQKPPTPDAAPDTPTVIQAPQSES